MSLHGFVFIVRLTLQTLNLLQFPTSLQTINFLQFEINPIAQHFPSFNEEKIASRTSYVEIIGRMIIRENECLKA